ncbi:MAG: deoxyribose-phosphate aldolase [Acidimicrobiales bacterium]
MTTDHVAPTALDAVTVLAWDEPPSAAEVAARVAAATARSVGDPMTPAALVAVVDLTTLEGSDTADRVTRLGRQAAEPADDDPSLGPAAAVCVYPSLVPAAVAATAGTPVGVASVAGAFPSAQSPLPVRLADIATAAAAGADEIDIVLNRSAFLAGDLTTVTGDLVASIAAAGGRPVKVILEVGELVTPEAVHTAALLAMAAGAAFVKTSTGKIPAGATPEAVAVMTAAAERFGAETGRPVGVKVSGGVRSHTDAALYGAIVAGRDADPYPGPDRFRIGASGLLDALVAAHRDLGSGGARPTPADGS